MPIFYHISAAEFSPFRICPNSAASYFPFFAARRSRDDFGLGPFADLSDTNSPALGVIPQHLPVVEYFMPLRL